MMQANKEPRADATKRKRCLRTKGEEVRRHDLSARFGCLVYLSFPVTLVGMATNNYYLAASSACIALVSYLVSCYFWTKREESGYTIRGPVPLPLTIEDLSAEEVLVRSSDKPAALPSELLRA